MILKKYKFLKFIQKIIRSQCLNILDKPLSPIVMMNFKSNQNVAIKKLG